VLSAFALWLTAVLLPGFVQVRDFWGALLAAAVLGLVNALVRPIFVILTLPLTLLTLGLFLFVVNAAMLGLAAALAGSALEVNGFWGAVVGSIVLSLISLALNLLVGREKKPKETPAG
jgi:putative membrane protein